MVYFTKVSVSIIQDVQNLRSMDTIIANDPKPIDDFFGKGDLSLKDDEVFIMSGGKGSVKAELDRYNSRSISLAGARRGDYLAIRGYYVKRGKFKPGTVYIIISASTWTGYRSWPELAFPLTSSVPTANRDPSITLANIAAQVLDLAKIDEDKVKTKN